MAELAGGSNLVEVQAMSDQGESILTAVRQVRGLHEDISLLLRTADTAMGEQDWTNAKNDGTALFDMSWSIDRPKQWMPWEVFRFYCHDGRPTVLASISVLLDDGEDRLREPVVSGACFDFGKPLSTASYPNWIGGIFKSSVDHEAGGQWLEVTHERLGKGWNFPFRQAWCFAYPLVTVTSEEVLREQIVGHLLSHLGTSAA